MSGIYQQSPRADAAFRLGELDPPRRFVAPADGNWPAGIPGTAGEPYYERPAGYWKGAVDWETITEPKFGFNAAQNNNTDGLIDPDTNLVKTQLPPNSRSFILGPLVDGFVPNHIGDAFTRIGYIEKDTRQFVLLGIIQGEWVDGLNDEVSGGTYPVFNGQANQFTQVNPNFTFDMVLWFRNEMLKGRFVKNVSYNAVGGIPQQGIADPNAPQTFGGNGVGGGSGNAGENPDGTGTGVGSGGNPTTGTEQGDSDDNDIDSLNLHGLNYSNLPPKPDRSDYPNTRSGAAAYSRAMSKWKKLEAALAKKAGLETQNPIFNQDNWETVKDAGSKIADTLWSGAKILAGLGKGKKHLADFIADYAINPLVDRAFGFSVADSAGEYNQKLLTGLGTSVLTGKNQEIKLSDKAKKDLINSIDTDMLKKHLTVGPTPVINSDNAVNPGKGKQNGLLKGAWGNQGGTHINYDPSNGKFTVTMVKMLRDFGELDTRQPNNQAVGGDPKITNFHDIPTPTTEQIRSQFSKVQLDKFFKLAGKYSPHRLRGFSGDDVAEAMSTRFEGFTKAAYNLVVQGSASNIVHFRNEAIKLGVPQSEIEKMGAGFGGYVYSQATFTGKDIPGNHSDKNSVTGIVNRAAMRSLGIEVTETRKIDEKNKVKILREIRQPLKEIKELPKTTKLKGYKPNFKGKYSPQNTPDVTASKRSDQLVMAKNAEGQAWTVGDKYQKGWETTGRMNHVYARVGESNKFFEEITSNNSADVDRKMQEHLNHVYHNKAMLKIDSNFKSPFIGDDIDESEKYDNKINDHLFTNVANRLKKEIDYPKKPAAKGYPNEAPPKIDPNTGYHPKFGKRYKYDKLDPISAKTMAGAPTGDPEIDANVKKAAKIKESWRSDLKNLWLGSEREDWRKKLEEGMNTSDTFTYSKAGRGDTDLATTGTGYQDGIHQLQNIPPMTDVDDPTNVGKKLGGGPIGAGYHNAYGGIDQYTSSTKETDGEENAYWKQAVSGTTLDDNDNPRYSDYIYPFDRRATGAEIQTAKDASLVRGDNDVFRATYPTNVFSDRHKATPVATNPTVGVDDDYDTAGLGVRYGGAYDTRTQRFFLPAGTNTSEIDTVKILASVPVNNQGIAVMNQAGSQLQLYYWAGDKPGFQSLQNVNSHNVSHYPQSKRQFDGWRPIAQKPNGEIDSSVSSNIIDIQKPVGFQGGKVSEFTLQIPEWCRSTNTRFMFLQMSSSNGGPTIYSIRYQRRNALTINTTLADEKASAFVRVGNNSQMSPEERKKKLNDMLKASREYMLKSLGFASLFNDEVKISDVVSSDYDFQSVMQGSGAFGNTRFNDLVSLEKRQKAAGLRKPRQTKSRRGRFRGYQRTGRDSKGMTTRARVNPNDIIGSI